MSSLSQHFDLSEFVRSDVATRQNIDNTPPAAIIENLKRTAQLMENIRSLLCQPIVITSGYRCSALNKIVGGKPNSQHVQGLACDFKVPTVGDPVIVCQAIKDSGIVFGKLILEFYSPDGGGWTHVQVGTDCTVLTINQHGTFAGITP